MEDFSFCPSPPGSLSFDSTLSAEKMFAGSRPPLKSFPSNATVPDEKENRQQHTLPAKPSFLDTPSTPTRVKPIRVIQAPKRRDDLPAMIDLISWRNPPASFGAMAGGAVLCFAAHWMFSNSVPFLSGASTMLAGMLALNFFRGAFSMSWLVDSTWQGSNFEQFLIDRSRDTILFITLARDQLMCSENPWTMLQTCIVLALVRNTSYYVSFWTIVAAGWVAMFIVAPFRHPFEEAASKAYNFSQDQIKAASSKLKMKRWSKAAWLSMAIAAVMILTDSTSRAFLGLAFLMFIRCCMKKEEVEAFQKSPFLQKMANSHLVRSALRTGETVAVLADDVLMSAMKSARKHMETENTHES